MGQLGDLMDGGDEARDVRRAAHRDQTDFPLALLQRALDRREVDVPVGRESDHDVPAAMPPGEQVGVVLHLGHQHLPAIEPGLLGGDPVQGVGRALDEDDDLRSLVHAEKP